MSGLTNSPAATLIGTHADRLLATPTGGQAYRETDTGLVYRGNGTSWDIWNPFGRVAKTALQTINNSATLTNDTQLFFPIEVSETWFCEAYLLCTGASATGDWQFGFTGPTGASASWGVAPSAGAWTTTAVGGAPGLGRTLAQNSAIGGASGQIIVYIGGWFFADTTHSGTITLQWAQNTQTAEDNTINAGSFLALRRVI